MEFLSNFFETANMGIVVALFVVGLIFIIKGGDWFVDSASWIAEVLGVPKFIIGATIVSSVVQLGDAPRLEQLIGPFKVVLDEYTEGKLDAIYLCYNKFSNTMRQEPVIDQLLPLPKDTLKVETKTHSWEYIYEPDAPTVIDALLQRYIEALLYQSVAENIGSEQSARYRNLR